MVISTFFTENIVLMRIVYAILFFLMGFAIFLKLNRGSELKIAKCLWLLAFYAFSFGLYLLVLIFLQIKEPYLTEQVLFAMRSLSLGLIAVAFMMIFWLGIGFDPDKIKSMEHPEEKRGLENIFHRVMILQGKSMFHSASRQGTHFEFTFPYNKGSYLQTVFVEDPKYFDTDTLGQQKGVK